MSECLLCGRRCADAVYLMVSTVKGKVQATRDLLIQQTDTDSIAEELL